MFEYSILIYLQNIKFFRNILESDTSDVALPESCHKKKKNTVSEKITKIFL